jgi:PAS domain S-box-containing protein
MRQRFKLILEGQNVPALEKKIVRPDGSLRDVEVNARHYANKHRHTVEVILRNVTERKQTDEAFRESEARFRRIYESNILALAFSSLEGRLLEANQAFCELIGFSLQEIRRGALSWHKIIPVEWHSIYNSSIDAIKSGENPEIKELRLATKSNSIVPVIFGASVVRGSIVQIVTFAIDASHMKKKFVKGRKSIVRW